MAAAVVQLGGLVLIWHLMDWFSTAVNGLLFIWGTFFKRKYPLATKSLLRERIFCRGGQARCEPQGDVVPRTWD
jgi:hypothetical protein